MCRLLFAAESVFCKAAVVLLSSAGGEKGGDNGGGGENGGENGGVNG
jgi:hypothetical protein